MQRLKNRVALITGGASGLGRAIAQRLRSEGATTVITDIQQDLGQLTAAECDLTFFMQDVANEDQWSETMRKIQERFGRLDIQVNNAGIFDPPDASNPETASLNDWRRIFAINVEGVFLGCRAAIPLMRRGGSGSIINIASVAGFLATPYATAYGASKAAVRQLTKSVAQHCAQERSNIRCNSVHPGTVRTPLWDRQAMAASRASQVPIEFIIAEAQHTSPMGDLTLPEDVAAAVAFLASDDARHITGDRIIVDGGLLNCDSYHIRLSARRAAQGG